MPSPVAIAGFVVSRNTWPAPPVAISVRCAVDLLRRAVAIDERRARARRRRASTSDIASASSKTVTRGCAATFCQSTRPISRPVASRACSTRRTLCAASRPSAGLPVGVAIERRAPLDQLAHVARAFVGRARRTASGTHRPSPAAIVSLRVQLRRVVGADRRGDAALRVAGVALARIGLGEDDDAAGVGQRDRGAQTGDAAADHEEIAADAHGAILSMPTLSAPDAPCSEHCVDQRSLVTTRSISAVRIDVTRGIAHVDDLDRRRPRRSPARAARRARRRRAPLRRLEPGHLAPPRRADAAGARRRRADPHPRRRALQEPAVGLAHLRGADPRRRRSRQRASSRSAAASSATPPALPPRRSCAASRWRTCRRRCWRRWTARSAARSASTTRSART